MTSRIFTRRRGGVFVPGWAPLLIALPSAAPGCASDTERATRRELARVESRLLPLSEADDPGPRRSPTTSAAVRFDGSLAGYERHAFAHSPELRASFEAWRAASYRPRKARRLPELTLTYAGFIRSVETRVGPQRHRLGVQQWFPWPTKLTAAGEAEALAARAAQSEFEAQALVIAAEVARAYWRLWLVQRTRDIERERVTLLEALVELVRVRVEANAAGLSDLTQLELRAAHAEDVVAGLDEGERAASAALVRAVGAPDGTPTPVAATAPTVGVPGEGEDALHEAVAAHPRIRAMAYMSASSEQRVRQSRADRYPSFGLGVDWIITGQALDPAMPDSGKDAVIGMAAIKVPLSIGSYRAGEDEARARSKMYRARELAVRNRAIEEYERIMAELRDANRRVALYEGTMTPLAEASYEAVQTGYQSGRATVAEVLMAERELLDVQLMALRARVDAANAWAELERVVGRPVRAAEVRR